jgi:hypothetical protein
MRIRLCASAASGAEKRAPSVCPALSFLYDVLLAER